MAAKIVRGEIDTAPLATETKVVIFYVSTNDTPFLDMMAH